MDKDKHPGINFDGILLANEKFSRVPNLPGNIKVDIGFSISLYRSGDIFTNEITTKLACLSDEDEIIMELEFTYIGLFSVKKSEENMDIKTFMNRYSHALMFPYIREHITSITQKAGMSPILLPPLNILAMTKEIKDNIE